MVSANAVDYGSIHCLRPDYFCFLKSADLRSEPFFRHVVLFIFSSPPRYRTCGHSLLKKKQTHKQELLGLKSGHFFLHLKSSRQIICGVGFKQNVLRLDGLSFFTFPKKGGCFMAKLKSSKVMIQFITQTGSVFFIGVEKH